MLPPRKKKYCRSLYMEALRMAPALGGVTVVLCGDRVALEMDLAAKNAVEQNIKHNTKTPY